MSVVTGLYNAGLKIQTIVDRSQHQQNVSLQSFESPSCWLDIAGNVMSFASGGAKIADVVTVGSDGIMVHCLLENNRISVFAAWLHCSIN